MTHTETASETSDTNCIITPIIAREGVSAHSRHKSFKTYMYIRHTKVIDSREYNI
jgi:hypothetical protein